MVSAILTTATMKAAHADDDHYLPGWYTLFKRVHCAQGDDDDGGCFCNNPHDCKITFTNDAQTNERILLDIIKSQGNGHFIPSNLQDNFNDILNSIQTGNIDHPFSQCVSIEQNAETSIHLGCSQLLGIVSQGPFHEEQQDNDNDNSGNSDSDNDNDNY